MSASVTAVTARLAMMACCAVIAGAVGLAGPMADPRPTPPVRATDAPAPALTQTQPPQRDAQKPAAPTAPVGTGSIVGVVVRDDGGQPLANAPVVLVGIGTGVLKITATDAAGEFRFERLPPDRYTLGASKPPLIGSLAGARRPARPGTPVAVAAGQRVSGVEIRLHLPAVLSGVVTNQDGTPAAGAIVSALRGRFEGGERTLDAAGVGVFVTDDRGRYRIHGLLPGEYVVTAIGQTQLMSRVLSEAEVDAALRGDAEVRGDRGAPPAASSVMRSVPTYYPGSLRATDAVPMLLAAGEERANVNFQLQSASPVRVEAQVVTADGQPVGTTASVSLRTLAGNIMQTTYAARPGVDGRVVFTNVPPDTYALVATGGAPAAGAPAAGQFGFITVDVGGRDVTGLQIVLRSSPTIAGTIAFRGTTAAPPLANWRVPIRQLSGLGSAPFTAGVSATTAAGEFIITNLGPGRYVIGGVLAAGPSPNAIVWTLESVVADGRDITDLAIDLGGESTPRAVVVTYTDRFQELVGRLSRAGGAPVSEYTILVFAEERAYWIPGSRRIVATRPDTDGLFTLSGRGPASLPPGRYLLAAVTDLDRDEQYDPAFLASIAPAAVPVTVGAGERTVQDLIVR